MNVQHRAQQPPLEWHLNHFFYRFFYTWIFFLSLLHICLSVFLCSSVETTKNHCMQSLKLVSTHKNVINAKNKLTHLLTKPWVCIMDGDAAILLKMENFSFQLWYYCIFVWVSYAPVRDFIIKEIRNWYFINYLIHIYLALPI